MSEPLTISEVAGLVILKISGPLTRDQFDLLALNIEAGKETIKQAAEKQGKKINVLIDINEFDGTYDAGAMQILADFAKANEPFIKKTAGFGKFDMAIAAGEVTALLAERQNIKFFPSREEAMAWLEQGQAGDALAGSRTA